MQLKTKLTWFEWVILVAAIATILGFIWTVTRDLRHDAILQNSIMAIVRL